MEFKSKHGKVTITPEVMADIVGVEIKSIPGVVGMVSKQRWKDGIAEVLKKENYSKGIVIQEKNGEIDMRIHIMVLYGIHIPSIAESVQKRIQYRFEEIFGINVSKIHIKIEDVRVEK